MSLLITHNCINCDMCEPECPNAAISIGEEVYQINPNLCTECIGHYDKPNCQSVCPINNTIIKNSNNIETKEQLWDKFVLLHYANKI
ncbi:putative ferredoxin-like protein YfhL [Arsenophonus endosymbiont of Aleurodicus dispersus]|uniref:YfhL family 4Fe-4S dicluster ferredoxin n=1 Tax=Arsenophonus endosymbiont of Aleurodicus dispersus TaxID=235559 RepID=UPI000EADCBDC|nr:YfhL family 4Fe-4S dicluster ferredoxin [Arsenophonus endosymbiont of Aleurodicus dispersus]VAY02357.1 putative ferredoxin-like protein YfhL [Arsenophonus endosymbiont of Aleurodicus dispersus]